MKKNHLILVICLILFGCNRNSDKILMPEKMFSLSIGQADNSLPLFSFTYSNIDSVSDSFWDFNMRYGLFYLSANEYNKIVEYNSYGSILNMYYDDSLNPKPILLEEKNDLSTNGAYVVDFNQISKFAVDASSNLYIVDLVPSRLTQYSEEFEDLLTNTVICLDSKGETMFYLGQEGISGSPFPTIENISVEKNIQIVSRVADTKIVYIFGLDGSFKDKYIFNLEDVPIIFDECFPVIDNVIIDIESNISLKIDYYKTSETKGSINEISFYKSCLWFYNLKNDNYESYITLPAVQYTSDRLDDSSFEVIYDYLGNDKNNISYFSASLKDGLNSLISFNKKNYSFKNKIINVPNEDIIYCKFKISYEGLLIGSFLKKDTVDIYRWLSYDHIE